MSEDQSSRRSLLINGVIAFGSALVGAVVSPFAQYGAEKIAGDEHRLVAAISGDVDLHFLSAQAMGFSMGMDRVFSEGATPVAVQSTPAPDDTAPSGRYLAIVQIENSGDFPEESVTAVVRMSFQLNDADEPPLATQITVEATNLALASDVVIESTGKATPSGIQTENELSYRISVPLMVPATSAIITFSLSDIPVEITIGGQSSDIAFESAWSRPIDINPDFSDWGGLTRRPFGTPTP